MAIDNQCCCCDTRTDNHINVPMYGDVVPVASEGDLAKIEATKKRWKAHLEYLATPNHLHMKCGQHAFDSFDGVPSTARVSYKKILVTVPCCEQCENSILFPSVVPCASVREVVSRGYQYGYSPTNSDILKAWGMFSTVSEMPSVSDRESEEYLLQKRYILGIPLRKAQDEGTFEKLKLKAIAKARKENEKRYPKINLGVPSPAGCLVPIVVILAVLISGCAAFL